MLPLLHTATSDNWYHWHLHADVLFVCALLVGAYWYATTQLRDVISDARRVRRSQAAVFVAGVVLLYAASSSPMHELSENYLVSAHMLQHLVYTMVVPPLLIAGVPTWLYRAPLKSASVFRVARLITLPLVAFSVFNAVQLLTHLPSTVDLALNWHYFHLLVHVALVATALLMWWPVLSPIEELPRLSYPLQMAYLFVQSLLPAVLAAFITFSNGVFYDFYATTPRIWGLTPIEDQQFAGFVMKILGSLILWGFIAFAFFRWYQAETARDREPRWDEVREELTRLGLPIEDRGRLN
jgi:putative membrane protein